MKILFVTATLHPGGSERVMSIVANGLAARGHQVEIVCINKHLVFYPLDERIRLSFAEDEVGQSIVRKTLWLRRHVKATKPDVVIAFMLEVYCLTLAALIGVKVPVVSSERVEPSIFGLPKRLLRWLLLWRTSRLVVQTESIKAYYPHGIQRRTVIIPNPVSEKVFGMEPVPKEHRLIAVGRLAYQKNYTMMLDAFKEVQKDFPDYRLLIFGDGPERELYRRQITERGLEEHVLLMGESDRVLDEMNGSELFVMTSNFEGMSNAMLEAVCLGLPVVTTRVSGTDELVEDDRGGFIVPIGDTAAFADRLRQLLSDDTLRQQMSSYNRQKAPRYQEQAVVDQWEALLQQA